MQEQDGCEVEMKESWKVCEGLQGWLRKRWWWWWWSCDSTFNIWLEKGVLGKTRNRPSFSLPRGVIRQHSQGIKKLCNSCLAGKYFLNGENTTTLSFIIRFDLPLIFFESLGALFESVTCKHHPSSVTKVQAVICFPTKSGGRPKVQTP